MERDPLFDLLKGTDSGAALPRAVRGDLASSVYRRHRRRRVVRSGAVLGLLLSVALSGVLLQRVDVRPQVATSQPADKTSGSRLSRADIEMIALDNTADLHARTADLLRRSERTRSVMATSQQRLKAEDALDVNRREKNRAALTLVAEADRLSERPGRADEAGRIYRRTVELFPGTPAAEIAARRLGHLQT